VKRKFEVVISLKAGLLDPQGKALEETLPSMGFEGISDVRVGKHIALTVDADDDVTALAMVERMAEQLFSNPVIESHRIADGQEVP